MNIDLELIRAISAFGTAIGVVFAAVQLWRSKQQQVLRFEDEIAKEYREIARAIPVEALLGKPPTENYAALNNIYPYIVPVQKRQNNSLKGTKTPRKHLV